jgi:hypothetical protein
MGTTVEHETGRGGENHGMKGVKDRGSTEEEGKSTNIWGNSIAEEPFKERLMCSSDRR